MAAQDNVHPQQLKMFMTPREIMSQYQPLDGDRQDANSDRYGSYTARSHNTRGDRNWPRHREQQAGTDRKYYYEAGSESDEQVWDRKLEESQMSKWEYNSVHGDGGGGGTPEFDMDAAAGRSDYPQHQTGHTRTFDSREDSWMQKRVASHDAKVDDYMHGASLHDSIASEGVQYPAHLGSQFGSQNKPEVVGGHHRIAAAFDVAPDQPIPVLHHENIVDARSSAKRGGFEYR